jgi:plasmid stability protein
MLISIEKLEITPLPFRFLYIILKYTQHFYEIAYDLDKNDCIACIDVKTKLWRSIIMANLTIRNINESLKTKLRVSAAENGRSMEEEARQILKQSLLRKKCLDGMGSRIIKRFSAIGGVNLPEIERSNPRKLSL